MKKILFLILVQCAFMVHAKIDLLAVQAVNPESNASYKAASQILSDATLQQEYRQQLFLIQLQFSEYLNKTLRQYSAEQAQAKKVPPFADLLEGAAPVSSTPTKPMEHLSNLIAVVSHDTPKSAQTAHAKVSLLAMAPKVVATPKVVAPASSLNLMAVPQSAPVPVKKVKKSLNLLAAG